MSPAVGSAEGRPEVEIIAPEGSDIDLKEESFYYFGRAGQPVIARTQEFSLTARRIDYNRKEQELSARGDVVLIGEEIKLQAGKSWSIWKRNPSSRRGGSP